MSRSNIANNHKFNQMVKGKISEEVYDRAIKMIIVEATLHSFHDFNIILETDEGNFTSSNEDVKEICKYMLKYIKNKQLNATVADVASYRNEMLHKHNKEEKICYVYVDARKSKLTTTYGSSQLVAIKEDDLREKVREMKKAQFYASPLGKFINGLLH